jgi:hypothetical protein
MDVTTAADRPTRASTHARGHTHRAGGCGCGCRGGGSRPSGEEAIRDMVEAVYRPYLAMLEALQQPSSGMGGYALPGWGLQPQAQAQGCGCGGSGGCAPRDDCHCRCCVVDADLVVHTRLGERRIVPITLTNDRRREREVSLELSDFTTRGGSPAQVSGRVVGPERFTLAACSEREVVLAISVDLDADGDADREQLRDVDDCVVAYGDLRIVGCDNRAVRIAVSVLPRDCDAHRVRCERHCC